LERAEAAETAIATLKKNLYHVTAQQVNLFFVFLIHEFGRSDSKIVQRITNRKDLGNLM